MKSISYGIHTVFALLEQHPEQAITLFLQQGRSDNRLQDILALANTHQIPIESVTKAVLAEKTGALKHQGVALMHRVVKQNQPFDTSSEEAWLAHVEQSQSPAFILILDSIQDPHNLGACLRSSDAAGVDAIVIPKDNAVDVTPVVRKVACGAAEYVPIIQVTNLTRTIHSLQEAGVWVYALDGDAEQTIFEADLRGSVALVLGAEGKGIRRLVREACDFTISIPMLGMVDSLNVSVATGICLYEAVRQRNHFNSS